MFRSTILCFLFSLCSIFLIGQEICDNAIDDDGDGLIDLNDDECDCTIGSELLLYEFEDKSCCPIGLGMVGCLDSWGEATLATPDYIHSCANSLGWVPVPFPSGEGCIGTGSYLSHVEQVYTCLPKKLLAGETYNVGLYVGFRKIGSMSPFGYALYGKSSCSGIPEQTQTCLSYIPTWTELVVLVAAADPSVDSSWVYTSDSFVSPGNFEALAIGPACGFLDHGYHYFDDFSIEGIFCQDKPTISESGDCSSGVTLYADHPDAISYQWYYNGIAIIGEINQTTLVNYPNNGPYTVVAYTSFGCVISDPYLVDIDPESLLFDADIINNLCYGFDDGSIQVTNINSQSNPFDYVWDNGFNTNPINNLIEGDFVVTVTDNNGCFGSATFSLVDPDMLEVVVTQIIQPQPPSILGCAEISILGGTPFYDINWENGEGTTKVSLEIGVHTVTVTDENGCIVETSVEIGAPMSYSVIADDSLCINDCSGTIVVFPIGGVSPYDIQWSNLMTGDTINNLCAGTYSATITDDNNSILEVDVVIQPLPEVVIDELYSNIICVNIDNGFINTSLINGVAPIAYSWSNGPTTDYIDSLSSGTYDLTITDGNLCSYQYQYDIQETLTINSHFSVTSAECGQNNGGIILDSINGQGPFTYSWSTGDSISNIDNISSGDYFVTISDTNDCLHLDTLTLSNIDEPIISIDIKDNSCPNSQDGVISITKVDGTSPPFFYTWSTGDSIRSIDSLAPGTYFLTVTYDDGCISVNEYNIDQLSSIDIDSSILDEVCIGDNDGQIIVSVEAGLSPHSFHWESGETANSINNLSPGNYNLTITDSLGCQYPYSYDIEVGGIVSASANLKPTSCNDRNDGFILISPFGIPPFNYVWDNGETTQNNFNLSQGFYNLLIEDSLGCSEKYNYFITSPPAIELTASVNQPGCEVSDSTGDISLNPYGGSGTLDITWDSGSKDSVISDLLPGNYIVTISDQNFCELIDTIIINEGRPLLVSGNVDSILCTEGFGNIFVEVIQGNSPYSYLWNDANQDSIRNNLMEGNYSVEVKDGLGCADTLFFELSAPLSISIDTIQNISPTSAGNDGIIEINPNGGSPPFIINWDNGDSGPLIDNLGFDDFTATITDANGCIEIISFSFMPLPLSVNYNIDNNLCFGDCLGVIDVNIVGGVTPYTFTWSNGAIDSTINNLCQGLYAVTIQDALGATFEFNDLEIITPSQIISSINSNDISCIGLEDGSINIMPSGGTAPFNIYLDNNLTNQFNNNLKPGNYSISIIDDNECQVDKLVTINDLLPLSTDVSFTNIDCYNSTGSVIINTDNSEAYPILLNGQNIGTSNEIVVDDLGPGVYQLSYMVNDNCFIDFDDIDIIDETAITITASPTFVSTNSGTEFTINIEIDDLQDLISDISWNDINGEVFCVDYNIDNHCILLSLTLNQSDTLIISTLLINGCLKEFVIPIDIIQKLDFDFPNTFSPNGDGINDELKLSFLPDNITLNLFDVFDRWGNKVFHFDNGLPKSSAFWDGKSNGDLVSQGVYVYIISISNEKGQTKFYKGDITVLR